MREGGGGCKGGFFIPLSYHACPFLKPGDGAIDFIPQALVQDRTHLDVLFITGKSSIQESSKFTTTVVPSPP